MRTDTELLDFLERYHQSLSRLTAPDMGGLRYVGQIQNPAKERGEAGPTYVFIKGPTIREAIDQAITRTKFLP